MKKLLLLLLALPVLTTAQEKSVQVPNPCFAGQAFTIKIPVRFPDSMTVQYAWYRNDTLIDDTHTLLLGEKAIAYTIPADKAFGSAVYHFTYNLHDNHDGKWTRSPRYAVTFVPPVCPPTPGAISVVVSCVSDVGTINVTAVTCISNAGTIINTAAVSCISNAGTIHFSP